MKKRSLFLCLFFLFLGIGVIAPGYPFSVQADTYDYISDEPVLGKKDKDDFSSYQEWVDYLNENPDQMVMTLGDGEPDEHIQLRAEEVITIPKLNSKRVVQQIAFDDSGKYLYVTQRVNTKKYAKGRENINISTYLYRCVLNREEKKAVVKDYMVIEGGGHGQTLEYYEHNGKPYFLITLIANENYANSWGLRIGRIQYTPGKRVTTIVNWKTKKEKIDVVHFKDLAYANKKGSYFGNVKRVDASLTNDRTKICFWIQNNNNDIQYSIYDAATLNKLWDEAEKKSDKAISCYKNKRLKSACLSSFAQYGASRMLPNLSNQGTEIDNDLNIYVIGGNYNIDTLIPEIPQIGMLRRQKNGSYTYSKLISIANKEFGEYTEVEGMKLTHDGIYFTIADHSSDKARWEKHIMFISYEQINAQQKHTGTYVKNRKKATYSKGGYTGDIYCSVCKELVSSGVSTDKLSKPTVGAKFTYNNLKYKITSLGKNKTVECYGIKGKPSTVAIPATVKYQNSKYTVTSIGKKAFQSNKSITKISIGKNVTQIKDYAFYKMSSLKTVTSGSNVRSIGKYAFSKCTKLSKLTFTSKKLSGKNIGTNAFSGAKSTVKIDVPNSKKKSYRTLFRNKGLSKKATLY